MQSDDDHSTQMRLLIHRVLAEDAGAFDDLVVAATERLRRLSHAMLSHYPQVKRWEDTEDVLQLVLWRLHRSLTEVRPTTSREFFGLAATQIRRSMIDLLRHHHGPLGNGAHHLSRGGGQAADDSGGLLAEAIDDSSHPASLQDWSAFHEAVDRLPDEEREVFALTWYQGLTRVDIAMLLNISEKTVIRRINRARLMLQKELGPDAVLA
jgi:RNA polymerase sigma factor (sigma-70 family)